MANGENQNPNPNPIEATPGAAARTITLKTADGEIFEVEEAVAMEFGTVKSFFEDDAVSATKPMPLPNVSGSALSRVITYCRRSLEIRSMIPPATSEDATAAEAVQGEGDLEAEKAAKQERKEFEAEFLKDESNEDVKELILAANYLNIKELLDFLCRSVALRIQNKSVEYARKFFGIEGDYTPEEEAQIRQEYAWAFEGVDED
ncbi:SKP1-like protein 20 [Castanea sativa]|uniref:SKP1-like protein 20 n=1 Tax=Castanea sativa TaxID=21020 RepID=UPI003F64E2CA